MKESLLDLKRRLTPAEYAAFLRAQGKIFYWEPARFYVIADLRLAQEALKNPALSADRSSFFFSRMPNVNPAVIADFFGLVGKMMVMSDGGEHARRRQAAAVGIDGELLDYYRPRIEAHVARLLAQAARPRRFDFANEIAEVLPGLVLAELFCIEESARAEFYQASLTMTRFFGGAAEYNNEEGRKVNEAALHLRRFFQALLEERRRKPAKDFFTLLLGSGLADDEIISQAVMMLVAGQVTTTDQLNHNLYQLLTTGVLPRLREEPALLTNALEEFNRLDPAVTYLFRTVKAPVTLGGQALEPEDVVFFANHAVNRDPEFFPEPDECRLDRPRNPHFAYGFGAHYCLGARLARIQMQACFSALIQQFPRLALDPARPAERNHYALAFSGFRTLPVTV